MLYFVVDFLFLLCRVLFKESGIDLLFFVWFELVILGRMMVNFCCCFFWNECIFGVYLLNVDEYVDCYKVRLFEEVVKIWDLFFFEKWFDL